MSELALVNQNSIWCEHPKYPGYRFSPEGNAFRVSPFKLVQNRTHGEKRYVQWRLWKGNKWIYVNAHRIICEIFHENKDSKPTVNHINGNKVDNRSENLEWATMKEQRKHALSVLNVRSAIGSRNARSKLVESDVLDIRKRLSQNEPRKIIAKDYGVSRTCVENIASRKRWNHIN